MLLATLGGTAVYSGGVGVTEGGEAVVGEGYVDVVGGAVGKLLLEVGGYTDGCSEGDVWEELLLGLLGSLWLPREGFLLVFLDGFFSVL